MGAGVTPPLAAVGRLPTTLTLFLALLFTLKSRHVYHAGRWPPFASALRRQYAFIHLAGRVVYDMRPCMSRLNSTSLSSLPWPALLLLAVNMRSLNVKKSQVKVGGLHSLNR